MANILPLFPIRFLISHGLSALTVGAHSIILAWIAIPVLDMNPGQWGVVQAISLLPNVLFIIVAGAWADRSDPAKILGFAQILLSVTYAFMGFLLYQGMASHLLLLVYALLVGIGNAFVLSMREKLLADIHQQSLQKRVSVFNATQLLFQGAGIALISVSELTGLAFILAGQAVISLVSSAGFFSLLRAGSNLSSSVANTLKSTTMNVGHAIHTVLHNAGPRQLLILAGFNGCMHIGVFFVLIPIIATRTYGFSVHEYAALQVLFVLGMVIAHISLLRSKTLEYPGQGALFSLLYTALIGFGLTKNPTEFGLYTLVFLWGLVTGISSLCSRLVLLSICDAKIRGKIMTVYQQVLFGAASIGALATGVVSKFFSFQEIFAFLSLSNVVLFVIFMLTRTLWSIRKDELG